MNSFSKLKTSSDEKQDRLSNLPEGILYHILSLSPTKDVGKTSILSKRWRYLFLAVPRIDIDVRDIGPNLVNFINRRLMLCRTARIAVFRLKSYGYLEDSLLRLWVTALVLRNIEVLEIGLRFSPFVPEATPKSLLDEQLGWESLVVLKLKAQQVVFKTSESVLFPNLKVLRLKLLQLECDDQSKKFKFVDKSYPLLEYLKLDRVVYQKYQDPKPWLDISLSTLKKLKLVTLCLSNELSRIDFHTPNLRYLHLRVKGWESGMQINMCRLESIETVYVSYEDFNSFSRQLPRVPISNVTNVRELYLSVKGWEDCVPLPQFPNLILLKINNTSETLMWNLLQQSPNLETLEFSEASLSHRCCPGSENAPPCFGKTLREIIIQDFDGFTGEAGIRTVRYILLHGVVLHSLVMHAEDGWMSSEPPPGYLWPFSITKKLLELKRGSPNCVINLL